MQKFAYQERGIDRSKCTSSGSRTWCPHRNSSEWKKQIDWPSDWLTDRPIGSPNYLLSDGRTNRLKDGQTDGRTEGRTERQTDRQTDRQAGRQAGRQTDTHTHTHTSLVESSLKSMLSYVFRKIVLLEFSAHFSGRKHVLFITYLTVVGNSSAE